MAQDERLGEKANLLFLRRHESEFSEQVGRGQTLLTC